MFKEHDSIELTRPLPKHGLVPGNGGVVVSAAKDGTSFVVEFLDDKGATIAVAKVAATDLKSARTGRVLAAAVR